MSAAGLRLVLVVSAAVLIARTAAAQPLSVQGQVSTWFTLNDADPSTPRLGRVIADPCPRVNPTTVYEYVACQISHRSTSPVPGITCKPR